MPLNSNCLGEPCAAFAGGAHCGTPMTASAARKPMWPGARAFVVERRAFASWRGAMAGAAAAIVPASRAAVSLATALRTALGARRHLRISRAELSTMDDRLLADIGLTREHAAPQPPRPVWFV